MGRNLDVGGVGLGFVIVCDVVCGYGGDIKLGCSLWGGFCVMFVVLV